MISTQAKISHIISGLKVPLKIFNLNRKTKAVQGNALLKLLNKMQNTNFATYHPLKKIITASAKFTKSDLGCIDYI